MIESRRTVQKYFAAANGYSGFRSYFGKIFVPQEFSAIFVLKGGPGTGKSSFMRKISGMLLGEGYDVEEIYCSSDPHSLDGVIGICGERKIAVLDGTAPHEEDAKIPGAIGSIINLGDNWDEEWLKGYREEILSLSKAKSNAYSKAYFYLSLCGVVRGERLRTENLLHDAKKLKNIAKNLAESVCEGSPGKEKTRLISSFGRFGEYRISTLEELSKKRFSPIGTDAQKELFMSMLYQALSDMSADMTVCPSPFDKEIIEAIYLPRESVYISLDSGGEAIDLPCCDTEDFALCEEGLRVGESIFRDAISESERWFSIASDLHFRLEEIYKRAMNFDKNDALCDKLIIKILKILGKPPIS